MWVGVCFTFLYFCPAQGTIARKPRIRLPLCCNVCVSVCVCLCVWQGIDGSVSGCSVLSWGKGRRRGNADMALKNQTLQEESFVSNVGSTAPTSHPSLFRNSSNDYKLLAFHLEMSAWKAFSKLDTLKSTPRALLILLRVHAKSFQLCPTLWDPMDHSLPGFSVHGILQVRILEWASMPSSRGSSWPRDQTHISYVSCTSRKVLFTTRVNWETHWYY